MGLIARFYRSDGLLIGDSPLINANFSRGLNQSGEWQLSLPAAIIFADQLALNVEVQIYYEGSYLIGGPIQDISQSLDDSPTLEVSGRDEFDILYRYAADSMAYYDDQNILAGLFGLLNQAGWRIGKLDTYEDATATITVDLRKEKTLLSQVAGLLKDQPGMVYRYGGQSQGRHRLDVGTLAYPVRRTLTQAAGLDYIQAENPSFPILTALTIKTTIVDRIDIIEAVGGSVQDNAGVKRMITLGDAIDADVNRKYDADYPIIETVSEQRFIVVRRVSGKPGGRVTSNPLPSTTTVSTILGESSGGAGTATNHPMYTFQPVPGRLKSFSFWTGTISGSEAALKALVFMWYLHEVNEASPHIPGALLQSGVIAPALWGPNRHCRIPITDGYTLDYGVRYQIRFGFTTIPVLNNYVNIVHGPATPLSRTVRMDYSTAVAGGYVAYNRYAKFVIETEQIDDFVGGSITESNPKFAPQKQNANATLTEVRNAASALYLWSKQYLDAHRVNRVEYNAQISGGLFEIKPGDSLRLLARAEHVTEDRFTNILSRRFEQVDVTLRVQSIKYSFQEGKVQGSVTFQNPDTPTESESTEISQYDTQEKQPPDGKIIPLPDPWSVTTHAIPVSAVTPDTVMSNGLAAKLVALTATPPVSSGDGVLIGEPFVVHDDGIDMLLEVVEEDSYDGLPQGVTVRIAVANRGWNYTDSATVTFYMGWR